MNEYEETWTYKFCDFPDLPQDLENQILELVNQETLNYLDYERSFNIPYTKNGESKKSLALFQYESTLDINRWVFENITRLGIANVRCSKSIKKNDGERREWRGPHTDTQRNYTLIYLLENGGDSVDTVFYHEKGETIVRDNALMPPNVDDMTEIDRVNIPLRRWCVINSRILHSVDNIIGTRISLQVGLSTCRGIKSKYIEV